MFGINITTSSEKEYWVKNNEFKLWTNEKIIIYNLLCHFTQKRTLLIYLNYFKDIFYNKTVLTFLKWLHCLTYNLFISKSATLRWYVFQYGKYCFCGNEILNSPLRLPDEECNTPCVGNSYELCGGMFKLFIFSYV